MIICLRHFIGFTHGLSHLRLPRLRVVADSFDLDGRIGEESVQRAVVTAATEDSIRRELAVLGRGASSGNGAGGADWAFDARTASDNTLSARRELPLAHPSVSLLAAA